MDTLRATLYTQLTFYPAAARAMPLLLQLTCDPEVADRHAILALCTDILTCGHHGVLTTGLDLSMDDIAKRYAKRDARAILKAATQAAGDCVALLADPEPKVRSAAAFFLAFVPQAADAVVTRQLIDHLPDGRAIAAGLLLEALRAVEGDTPLAESWAGGVMEMTFDAPSKPRLAGDLSAAQRATLEALTEVPVEAPQQATRFGLPPRPDEQRRWLGLDPPGALDEEIDWEIDGALEHRPLWQVIRSLQTFWKPQAELLDRLAADLPDQKLLAIIGQWFINAYSVPTPAVQSDPQGGVLGVGDHLIQILDRLGPEAEGWCQKMADELLARIPEDRPLGKGPKLIGNLVLKGLYLAAGQEPIEPRHYKLLSVGDPSHTAEQILERLPQPVREEAILNVIAAPDRPLNTESTYIGIGAPLLERFPSPALARAMLGLAEGIRARSFPMKKEKDALARAEAALAAAGQQDADVAALLDAAG